MAFLKRANNLTGLDPVVGEASGCERSPGEMLQYALSPNRTLTVLNTIRMSL